MIYFNSDQHYSVSAWLFTAFIWASRVAALEIPPTIESPIVLEEWLVVGPFPMGTREGYIDHLVEHGGEEKIRPEEGMTHPSPMAPGGVARWVKVKADQGKVTIDFKDIDWKALQAHHGEAGMASTTYAYTEYRSNGRRRVLVAAERVSQFYLNGQPTFGDVYGQDFLRLPVVLEDGINRILVKLRGAHAFSFTILPAKAPVVINPRDATTPDLFIGQSLDGWLAVLLINTTSSTLRNVTLHLHGDFLREMSKRLPQRTDEGVEVILPEMAPLSIQKVPIPLSTNGAKGDTVSVAIRVSALGVQDETRLTLRFRKPGEAFRVTFRSKIDQSIQHFSVLPPKDFDPKKRYALILTLHGAGVVSDGLVGAYSQKDWAFVVAPTNRRPFGFDWQDWGRLDAIEVLDESMKRFPIDENRVYLTGHSMGGHGVWHIGLHYPDRFAALAPSAGWTSFQLYAPFFLTRGYLYAPPELNAIREMVLREDVSPLFIENAVNLPAFILEGEKDDDVWPFHPRLMAGLLRGLGYVIVYREMPGKGHWWDDDEGAPGVACVDLPEMMDFLKTHIRDPNPKRVIFKTTNIAINNRAYWVEIGEMERLYEDARIEAEVIGSLITESSGAGALWAWPSGPMVTRESAEMGRSGRREIRVKTTNVKEFTLDLREGVVEPGKVRITVDGRQSMATAYGSAIFSKEKGYFTLRQGKERGHKKHSVQHPVKRPGHSGPIKEAFFSPFLFVYGTAGDEEDTALNRRLAVTSANYWQWRANGWVRVVPDTAVTEGEKRSYNLILFGGPKTNRVTATVEKRGLPISIGEGGMQVGTRTIEGKDLVLRMVYPSPFNPDRLVQIDAGTSKRGMELTDRLGTFYSAAGLPDYVVYDESVKTKGWGGVIAAGFFNKEWELGKAQK